MRLRIIALPLLAGLLMGCASSVLSLTGTWNLDVERSQWGQARKPLRVTVRVEHQEPALRYSGEVVYADGETREFSFDGAIDGNLYPAARSYGEGQIRIRRLSTSTVESVFTSTDGKFVETARTSISPDGKTLLRKIRVKEPAGEMHWNEVYVR